VKGKVLRIAESLAAKISSWEGVEAVQLGEAADIEVYDPFFTVDLDVYIQGSIPEAEDRRERFPEVETYESSSSPAIDRFVMEELPVSLHFMSTAGIDILVHRIIDSEWVFHEPGTNMLYRIEKGHILYSRSGWLAAVRAARAEIPEGFWTHVRARSLAMAEKALDDLGAAAFHSDDLLFLVSSAKLLKCVAGFLFALNRQFEPSPRTLYERLRTLPHLPDEFTGRIDSFLRPEDGLSPEARREIARLIVLSLVPMSKRKLTSRKPRTGKPEAAGV
jgi:hypothetical protein